MQDCYLLPSLLADYVCDCRGGVETGGTVDVGPQVDTLSDQVGGRPIERRQFLCGGDPAEVKVAPLRPADAREQADVVGLLERGSAHLPPIAPRTVADAHRDHQGFDRRVVASLQGDGDDVETEVELEVVPLQRRPHPAPRPPDRPLEVVPDDHLLLADDAPDGAGATSPYGLEHAVIVG